MVRKAWNSPGLWLGAMILTTLWYAWPQIFYSLFIVYDAIATYSPAGLEWMQPVLQMIEHLRSGSLWWVKQ
jgi:hypothetical protein